jgi:hypothetical protein
MDLTHVLEMAKLGLSDQSSSNKITLVERIEELWRLKSSWEMGDFARCSKLNLHNQAWGLYDLQAEVLATCCTNEENGSISYDMRFSELPSSPYENGRQWQYTIRDIKIREFSIDPLQDLIVYATLNQPE